MGGNELDRWSSPAGRLGSGVASSGQRWCEELQNRFPADRDGFIPDVQGEGQGVVGNGRVGSTRLECSRGAGSCGVGSVGGPVRRVHTGAGGRKP